MAIGANRRSRAAETLAQGQAACGLSDVELVERVASSPAVAAVVEAALEVATRAPSETKRQALGKVLAGALGGASVEELDVLAVLTRTLEAVDGPHVALMAMVSGPHDGLPVGAQYEKVAEPIADIKWREELNRRWPQPDLLDPLLQVIEREGLAKNVGAGTWDSIEMWQLTNYGQRFLAFLPLGFEGPM